MKNLTEFIAEAKNSTEDTIYTVYFGDGTMYNYYYDEAEANKAKDSLNKEAASNECVVKKEKKTTVEEA